MKRVIKQKECLILAGFLIMMTLVSTPALASQGIINIDDQRGREGDEVTFEVYVANAPNDVYALMLDVRYDTDILEYTGYTRGDLTTDFELFDVGTEAGLLRLGAGKTRSSPTKITEGARGAIINLTFNVLEGCADTTLTIERLLDNIINWETEEGSFNCLGSGKKKKGKKGGGGTAEKGETGGGSTGISASKWFSLLAYSSIQNSALSSMDGTSTSSESGYSSQDRKEAARSEDREHRVTYGQPNTPTDDRRDNESNSKDKNSISAKKSFTKVSGPGRGEGLSFQRPLVNRQVSEGDGREVSIASILPGDGVWISESNRRYERFLLSMILFSLVFLDGVAVFWVVEKYKYRKRQTST